MKLHFVRSIRGLQNFLAIPIMNPLAGFMIIYIYIYIYICDRLCENPPCSCILYIFTKTAVKS